MEKEVGEWIVEKKKDTQEQFEEQLVKYINKLKQETSNFSYSEAQREDGMHGILIVQHTLLR